MRLRPKNIALSAITTCLVVLTGLHLIQREDRLDPPRKRPAWIAPPRTGMDASSEAVRLLLEPGTNALAASCSEHPDAARIERYVLTIGRDSWAPIWGIDINVGSSVIEAAIEDVAWMPPAPPPGVQSDGDARPPPLRITLTRAQMRQISDAWSDENLWHAEQQRDAFSCRDGRPVSLESCVAGRYYARKRNCDGDALAGTERLWHAVSPLLPAPKP